MRRLRRTKKLASAAIFLMAFALLFPITAPVAMAQATTGSLRGVVTDATGANIPGAGIDTLALLAPGVIPGVGNVNGNGTTFSVNGNRARSNNFTIDGGDNNDLSIGGPNYFVDNQDIVAEFQVITNNFSAEYG